MNNIGINRLIKEVLDSSNNLVNIDINDVRDLFQEGGEIHTYDVSVPANEKNRMQLLMEQIKKCSKCYVPYHRALVFFYISETQPLLMEELKPLSEWIESIPGEFMIKWGMATLSIPKIRAIVALQ